MRIEERDGLLFVSVTLSHKGITQLVDDVILDTGAAQSLIDMTAVEPMDIAAEGQDDFVFMSGIGGQEVALRKRIDFVQFGDYVIENAHVDFAYLDTHPGINGLLGADILLSGRFIIDLDEMALYQR
ncbi:retropepsin-like aspartic protease [Alicyclobacillus fastidiosus]|uniref:retropepsin-like aspartic protease n=1 Tax=Alicyclobacillus fastidiosus TaxID=392011 RepID=UPI0023EA4C2E|nr:retropepsin-like aspartic protease [Alicyclobacillus fastidiosus]GMA66117.1 hypothetical protein GCM10025859_65590 [Alicyclobacillus fastidiosus]